MADRSSRIASVAARQIFDSRGRPTVEAEVTLADGSAGRACVPSGSSTGRHEAWELRDRDPELFGGLGVLVATGHVRGEIAARIVGMDGLDQQAVDHALIDLDGSPSLRRLGANAVLATSLATSFAAAVTMIARVRNAAAEIMTGGNLSTLLAEDGGLTPGFQQADQALELMVRAIEAAGLPFAGFSGLSG